MSLVNTVFKKAIMYHHQTRRSLFYWINIQFNAVDEVRTKQFGPDRTCAEWILRNGGTVKWVESPELVVDYNDLPKEGTTLRLQEVDASNTSVMHNGFAHFKGCGRIKKVIFHNCFYLDNRALAELHYLKKSLNFLQISNCPDITQEGLLHLKMLSNLQELVIQKLPSVKNMDTVVSTLKSSLPECNIKT